MKALCFTTSYNRPYQLYNIINNISNQSYKDITYSININYDEEYEKFGYNKLLQDFESDDRIKISFHLKQSQHNNYLNAIKSGDNNHDIFIKIDDDDIYHKNYIERALNLYKYYKTDILSFTSEQHINNNRIFGPMSDIGKWSGDNHETKFGMPSTYVFNRKALDLILPLTDDDVKKIFIWEDGAWRITWRKHNLTSTVLDEANMMTYNIHQHNVSSTFLLKKNKTSDSYIENINTTNCDIIYFKHPHWQSYIILNKRNNRAYNINNNDHGKFTVLDNKISIKWDAYNEENFIKHIDDNGYFYEKI